MRNSLRLLLPLALVLAIPAPGGTAPLAPTRFNFTADYVVVSRETTDPVAPVDTTIFIFTYSPGDHPSNAPPTATSKVGIYILVRNAATHEVLYFDTGEAVDFQLHMTPGLPSAVLTALIPTWLGSVMKVELTWIAAGPIVTNTFGPVREDIGDFIALERANFKERPAFVSGTISGGPIAITFVNVPTARLGITHQGTIYLRDPR